MPVLMATIESGSLTGEENITSAAARNGLPHSVRIAVAALLTGLLLWQADPAAIWNVVRGTEWRFVAIACLLVLLDRALMAYRWLKLLSPLDPRHHPPIAAVVRVFFVSTFLGTFLPASVGGDALRAYGLSRAGVGGADALASVLMDRLLGVLSILLVACAGAFLARDVVDIRLLAPALVVLGAACALALSMIFSSRMADLVAWAIGRLPRGQRTAQRIAFAIQGYAAYRAELVNVLAGSIAVQILRVLQTYFLGLALGLTLPLVIYFALVPIILLIVLMPVTVNGIGTAQAGFIWLFGQVGTSSATAFALSVLFLGIAVVGNLPGGLLYLTGGLNPSAQPKP
jgi:uncharacterized protein (TIRG00374 family)